MTVNLELNHKSKADGTCSIFFRITHKRKSKRIDSGFAVKRKYWKKYPDRKRFYLVKSTPNKDAIENKRKGLEDELKSLLNENPLLDINDLLQKYIEQKDLEIGVSGFFKYAVDFASKRREEGRSGYSGNLMTCIRNFSEYSFGENLSVKSILNGDLKRDIPFSLITTKKLNDFEHWLSVKGLATNTIYTNLKSIRTIYNKAKGEGVFIEKHNPFEKKKLKWAKTAKKMLERDEITKLENCKLDNQHLETARDAFLFSYYSNGLRWSDICTLQWSCINKGYLVVTPRKTASTNQTELKIRLHEKALKLLEKYKKKNTSKYIFPYIRTDFEGDLVLEIKKKNVLINKWLKYVASAARVQPKLSFHMARHTFASLALRRGVSPFAISQSLGQSDLKTTQIYLKELDQMSLDLELQKVFS